MNALDLVYIPLAAVTAPFWARKQRSAWGERFGKIQSVPARGKPRVLLHAVSVGEVSALRELVPLLTPRAHVVISVGTDTGIARARELFAAGGACDVVRYPVDFSWSVRRFLDAVKPDAVALVELEIWPNFVRACRGRGIPTCVINGRLSARSFRGYRRLRWFFRKYFGSLEFAAVQDSEYAERFEAMGVEPGNCLITGSMKWDSAKIEDGVAGAPELAAEMGITRPGPPLIVAGSTGPGEEALLAQAVNELEKELGPIQLLCAPRKPERFGEAAAAMGPCARRSAKSRPSPAPPSGRGPRFLLDTIGELRKAYALADVVVVGRSFGDLFGSDPIEPIGLGRATVIGPEVSDFAQIVAEFEKGGGIVRAKRDTLREVLRGLLTDSALRARTGAAGRDVIRRMQGASARHAQLLLQMVGASARQAVAD